MAHYDPRGGLAPHARRQVEALAASVDRLVVVTTATLTDEARAFLEERATLVERDNEGYDFYSYKVGLDLAAREAGGTYADLAVHDEVVVCNDTYVGPLRPYDRIFAEMGRRGRLDFWGLTKSRRFRPHVQSFFVAFRPALLRSEAFADFWGPMVPISNRRQVIKRYEIGMSHRFHRAGFRSGRYFVESEEDRRLARRRLWWWQARMRGVPRSVRTWRRMRHDVRLGFNPATALADRALEGGRMPFVKIDTLRYDPYGLGADALLGSCEHRFPEEFRGVREYLAETAADYPVRRGEGLRPLPLVLRPLRPLVAYRT